MEEYTREKFGFRRISEEILDRLKNGVGRWPVKLIGKTFYDPYFDDQAINFEQSHKDILLKNLNIIYIKDK